MKELLISDCANFGLTNSEWAVARTHNSGFVSGGQLENYVFRPLEITDTNNGISGH